MLVIYLYTFRHMKMPERYTFRHMKPKFRCLFRDSLRLFNSSCFAPYALKGQKLLAQGNALGNYEHKPVAL